MVFSRVIATAALLSLPLLSTPVTAAPSAPERTSASMSAVSADEVPTVIGRRVIGHSVRGRPIYAWRVGDPESTQKAVIVSTMHGDEPDTRQILRALRDGSPVKGIDMWLVPTYNPDGLARHTRKNAHGVDLNRNFPYRWANLDGRYESGPRAKSEPETRAMIAFLKDIRPRWIVSFHQPLYGVDMDTKNRRFAGRLANYLNLPRDDFDCGGVCHGTMTGWYNHNLAGSAVTAEYGAHPGTKRMTVYAPRQLLGALWARR